MFWLDFVFGGMSSFDQVTSCLLAKIWTPEFNGIPLFCRWWSRCAQTSHVLTATILCQYPSAIFDLLILSVSRWLSERMKNKCLQSVRDIFYIQCTVYICVHVHIIISYMIIYIYIPPQTDIDNTEARKTAWRAEWAKVSRGVLRWFACTWTVVCW